MYSKNKQQLERAATYKRRKIMKTQINTLVTGTTGLVGTNSAIREEISSKVLAENGDTLRVVVKSVELELQRSCSCSGKSWRWSTELTAEQFKVIAPNALGCGKINRYTFTIDGKCRATAQVWHRSNERKQWRFGYMHTIQEANILIL